MKLLSFLPLTVADMIEVKLIKKPLDFNMLSKFRTAKNSGCMNIFIGRVRNNKKEKTVIHLEYEAYEKMALLEMEKIAKKSKSFFDLTNIYMIHSIGKVKVEEITVIIAVSAPHRKTAIKATEFIIDALKKTVPIWKKEVYKNGAEWISNHP